MPAAQINSLLTKSEEKVRSLREELQRVQDELRIEEKVLFRLKEAAEDTEPTSEFAAVSVVGRFSKITTAPPVIRTLLAEFATPTHMDEIAKVAAAGGFKGCRVADDYRLVKDCLSAACHSLARAGFCRTPFPYSGIWEMVPTSVETRSSM